MLPIYDALSNRGEYLSFHMPSHNGGAVLEGYSFTPKMDITELFDTDNLHSPSGIIKKSQEKAARLWGAENAYYLINGSSCGILAAVNAFCADGDTIIADRFSHRSFSDALVFSGAKCAWVRPKEHGGIWCAISPCDLLKAVQENPQAKAVFVTAPNYFGIMGDIASFASIAHEAGMVLIVDCAHGAHFGLSDYLPPSPIALGADVVIIGAHKTLNSFTQSAILLSNVKNERLERLLTMYQSTSPSYLLLSSLDAAVEIASNRPLWDAAVMRVNKVFGTPPSIEDAPYRDAMRILFHGSEKILREKYAIEAECECNGTVICIASVSHTEDDLIRLKEAAEGMRDLEIEYKSVTPPILKTALSAREAFFAKNKRVSGADAIGHICARDVFFYPPGVPIALCGEVVDEAAAAAAEEFLICE